MPGLDRKVQERVGAQLRAMHENLVSQPLPPHLLELIQRLEGRDGADSQAGASGSGDAVQPVVKGSPES